MGGCAFAIGREGEREGAGLAPPRTCGSSVGERSSSRCYKKEADLARPKGVGKGVLIYTLTRRRREAVAEQPNGGKRDGLTRPFP